MTDMSNVIPFPGFGAATRELEARLQCLALNTRLFDEATQWAREITGRDDVVAMIVPPSGSKWWVVQIVPTFGDKLHESAIRVVCEGHLRRWTAILAEARVRVDEGVET